MKKIFLFAIAVALSFSSIAQSYKGSNRNQTVEEKLNEEYCTGMFKSTDGTILDVASNTSAFNYFNILDWLQGRVAGLQVHKSRTGLSIPVIRGNVAGVYVDEIPVSLSYLNAISSTDIAMIKVIRSPFYGGFNGGGGAIAIYTIKGEDEEEEGDLK
jgi:hypothetical protein